MDEPIKPKPKRKHGFHTMDLQRRREIASMGGRAVAPEDRTFAKNRELAASAGAIGGAAVSSEKRSYSRNRELAASAGAIGGRAKKPKESL